MFVKKLTIWLAAVLPLSPLSDATKLADKKLAPFERCLASVVTKQDTFAVPPLTSFLVESIVGDANVDTTIDYLALTKEMRRLQEDMTNRPADSSQTWLLKSVTLARTLGRLGFDQEADAWYRRVCAVDRGGAWGETALHAIIKRSVLNADTLALDSLARGWGRPSRTDTKIAAIALCAALYVARRGDGLSDFLEHPDNRIGEPFKSFFRSLLHFDAGRIEQAQKTIESVLTYKGADVPTALKLAALVRCADCSWKLGDKYLAQTEFQMLSNSRSAFVRSWAGFMLANIHLDQKNVGAATRYLSSVCEDSHTRWRETACVLKETLEGRMLLEKATLQ